MTSHDKYIGPKDNKVINYRVLFLGLISIINNDINYH